MSDQDIAIKSYAQAIESFVRSLILEIRRGRREGALFIIAVLCFAAGLKGVDFIPLPSSFTQYRDNIRWLLYIVGIRLCLWATARIWLQATPSASEALPKPAAIKGPTGIWSRGWRAFPEAAATERDPAPA
jgi:hypothetical protein